MKKYFLFPGQGSQIISMGKSLFDGSDVAKERFTEANDILGLDLTKICFEGPEEDLKATQNTQPALFTVGYIIYEALKNANKTPDFVAGHSLGEYTAIAAAGGFDFATGLKLVRKRGELMSLAKSGSMAAIMGIEQNKLLDICEEISKGSEVVVPANYNTPSQTVISGSVEGVKLAMEKCSEAGAKRVIALPVSGAFHSPLMQDAANSMKEVLANATINNTVVPLISNVLAKPISSGEEIKDLLYKQLFSPVQWVDSFKEAEEGVALEMGPGKVLMGLLRQINRGIKVTPTHTFDEVEAAIASF